MRRWPRIVVRRTRHCCADRCPAAGGRTALRRQWGHAVREIDIAVVLLRVIVGLTLVAHGYNHLWGRGGLAGTARWFSSLGMRPPKLHAVLSGAGELAAG